MAFFLLCVVFFPPHIFTAGLLGSWEVGFLPDCFLTVQLSYSLNSSGIAAWPALLSKGRRTGLYMCDIIFKIVGLQSFLLCSYCLMLSFYVVLSCE